MKNETSSRSNKKHEYPDLLTDEGRRKTYKKWQNEKISPDLLAKSGFYYSGDMDLVICPYCAVEGFRWQEGDDPLADHIKWAIEQGKTCSFLENQTIYHQTINSNGIARDVCGTHSPKLEENNPNLAIAISVNYPDYELLETRTKSFENWPISLKQKPDELAGAGFFYEGVGDRTICFYCGMGLKDWEEHDVPWEQHAQWSPKCGYLLLKKGEEYVQTQNSPIAIANPQPNQTKEDLLEKSDPVLNENKLCKICFKNEMQTVFIPCGHILACVDCSIVMKTCPMCRKTLTGVMRAYLS